MRGRCPVRDPATPEVGAGAERLLPRAREHEHPHVVVGFRRRDGVAQPLHDAERHRVPPLGSVDRRSRDSPGDLVANVTHAGIVGSRQPPLYGVRRVITIAIVGGVALVVVLVTRGSFSRLFRLPIQSIWMVLVAVVIQIFLALIDLPSDRFDDVGFVLVMASYAFLLAFCFVNLRISMMWVIGLGIALNALVIGLNQGMPTADNEVTTRSGRTIEEPIERTVKHRPESDDDLLPFLGDRLRVPGPVDEVISIGDIVIGIGIILLCYQGSRVRRPTRSRRSKRTARIAARLRQRESASQERVQAPVPVPERVPVQEQTRAGAAAGARAGAGALCRCRNPRRSRSTRKSRSMRRTPRRCRSRCRRRSPRRCRSRSRNRSSSRCHNPRARTDEHALSHDSPDDTLGVELKEVFARLAADEHAGDEPKEPDEDEHHEA